MDLKSFKFLSSNRYKIEEFQKNGIECVYSFDNPDMAEILGNSLQVILQKSKMGGPNTIVEDSIIEVDGVEIVDIKWRYKDFFGVPAIWRTSIGVNDGENIYIFVGEASVEISDGVQNPVGFEDNILIVFNNEKMSLGSLDAAGLKELFSARCLACSALKNFEFDYLFKVNLIPEWSGQWQNG